MDLKGTGLSEISHRERHILYDLLAWGDKQRHAWKKRSGLWLPEVECSRRQNWKKVVKTYKLPLTK